MVPHVLVRHIAKSNAATTGMAVASAVMKYGRRPPARRAASAM
jgi:hypothetical protein